MRYALKLSLLCLLLAACGAPSGNSGTVQTARSQPTAAPSASAYQLFTWLDPAQPTQASPRCSFALISPDQDVSTIAAEVRSKGTLGLETLDASLKALPAGTEVIWSDALLFMSSLQFGLPSPSRIAGVRKIAAERGLKLRFGESFHPDQTAGALHCAD